MIAVVFSGSRYADWRLAEKGRILHGFRTTGINPYIQDERFIFQLLNKNTQLINNAERIRKIYFFGAGARSISSAPVHLRKKDRKRSKRYFPISSRRPK